MITHVVVLWKFEGEEKQFLVVQSTVNSNTTFWKFPEYQGEEDPNKITGLMSIVEKTIRRQLVTEDVPVILSAYSTDAYKFQVYTKPGKNGVQFHVVGVTEDFDRIRKDSLKLPGGEIISNRIWMNELGLRDHLCERHKKAIDPIIRSLVAH